MTPQAAPLSRRKDFDQHAKWSMLRQTDMTAMEKLYLLPLTTCHVHIRPLCECIPQFCVHGICGICNLDKTVHFKNSGSYFALMKDAETDKVSLTYP